MVIQGKVFKEGELIIYTDYKRSAHAGAAGCFQVIDVCIDGDTETSILQDIDIDQGKHYFEISEVLNDLEIDLIYIDFREEVMS